MDEWMTIRRFLTRMDAELAKSMLTSYGIDCIILTDDAGGIAPYLTFINGIQLQVPKEQADEAIRLLSSPEQPTT